MFVSMVLLILLRFSFFLIFFIIIVLCIWFSLICYAPSWSARARARARALTHPSAMRAWSPPKGFLPNHIGHNVYTVCDLANITSFKTPKLLGHHCHRRRSTVDRRRRCRRHRRRHAYEATVHLYFDGYFTCFVWYLFIFLSLSLFLFRLSLVIPFLRLLHHLVCVYAFSSLSPSPFSFWWNGWRC